VKGKKGRRLWSFLRSCTDIVIYGERTGGGKTERRRANFGIGRIQELSCPSGGDVPELTPDPFLLKGSKPPSEHRGDIIQRLQARERPNSKTMLLERKRGAVLGREEKYGGVRLLACPRTRGRCPQGREVHASKHVEGKGWNKMTIDGGGVGKLEGKLRSYFNAGRGKNKPSSPVGEPIGMGHGAKDIDLQKRCSMARGKLG